MQFKKSFTPFYKVGNVSKDGIISGVVIITEGLCKNGDFHDKTFLQAMVEKGNENEKGIPSRFGHPGMDDSTPKSIIGRYRNFRIQDGQPQKILADFHLDPKTKKIEYSPGYKLYDFIVDLANDDPDAFGNSVVYYPDMEKSVWVNEQGEEDPEGCCLRPVLKDFTFSDLVDVPAATESLFESINKNKELKNKKQKSMSDLQKLQSVVEGLAKQVAELTEKVETPKVQNLEYTLANGTAVVVVTEGTAPALGDRVELADGGGDVPDEDHVLQDGSIIETEGSVIVDIRDGEGETGDDAPAEEANSSDAKLDQIIELLTQSVKANEELKKAVNAGKSTKQPQIGTPNQLANLKNDGGLDSLSAHANKRKAEVRKTLKYRTNFNFK